MDAAYYEIDGDNERFETLRAAKNHIWMAYSDHERLKYFSNGPVYIAGLSKEGRTVSLTEIKVKKYGRVEFGKTFCHG